MKGTMLSSATSSAATVARPLPVSSTWARLASGSSSCGVFMCGAGVNGSAPGAFHAAAGIEERTTTGGFVQRQGL